MPHHTNNKDNSTRVLYVRVEVIWNNSESTLVKKKKKMTQLSWQMIMT